MVLTRIISKRKRLSALKQSVGQDVAIQTGRGCISGTLISLKDGDKLVLRLKNVRVEGDSSDDSSMELSKREISKRRKA